ncbi:MAG: hypothetical protein KDC05_10215 [Bacteroidales bacterium]|nr:hypothetical protein [Bacteroidales bacterium]
MKTVQNLLVPFMVFISISITSAQSEDSTNTRVKDQYRWERFSVNLGVFLNTMNNDLQLGSSKGFGVTVNLENALGLTTSTFVMRGKTEYNFGKKRRSSLRLGFVSMTRNASKTLEGEITIGDYVYKKGITIKSSFGFTIIRAVYDYAFYQDNRARIGLTGGFFAMPVNFSIEYLDIQTAKFVAPLPVIGLRSSFQITPKVTLKQSAELFYIKILGYTGSISDINFVVDYKILDHFGVGLGLNSFKLNVEATQDSRLLGEINGTVKSGVSGVMLFARYFF